MISAEHKENKKILRNSLPVEITAQHAGTRKIMAGPLQGKLFDFSKHNACLLTSQIMDETYHLFYSTQEDNLLFLNIFFDKNPSLGEPCRLTALPLWFNIFQQGQIRNFIMGVEFTRNTEEKTVKKLLAKQRRTL
jgi:hypothetical protein